jgi:hypothetical protein
MSQAPRANTTSQYNSDTGAYAIGGAVGSYASEYLRRNSSIVRVVRIVLHEERK